MLYFCVCNQAYSQKSELRKHVSVCKSVQIQSKPWAVSPFKKDLSQLEISECENQTVNIIQNNAHKDLSTEKFKCGCKKIFQSKGGYYRHIKKCQLRPQQQVATGKTKCNEPGCLLTFKYIRDFRQHLNEKHNVRFDVEDTNFNRYSDFLCWKEKYEIDTRSCFYHRKTENRSGRRVEYWYCNRSGIYQSASQGRQRKLKSQGILKINNNCTSSITLTINETEGTVHAIIHHTHYGHKAELVHLRIPKSDKQEIASKLLQGVKIDDILLSYKEDGLSNQIERKHLIKRRDILNISKKYNVNIILPKVRQPPIKRKKNAYLQETTESLTKKDSNTIETNKRHIVASKLSFSLVNPINHNVWKVSIVNRLVQTYSLKDCNDDVCHVSKTDVTCCNDGNCKSYCNSCNICYHSYSCECSDFLIKKIICEHIHLVVLYQITPQTYEYVHNIQGPIFNNHDHTAYTQNLTESTNISQPIGDDYVNEDLSDNNDYKSNKLNTELENLKCLKSKLEKLMLQVLQKVNECNNCDLLEDIEKRITNITCDLSTDLLQSKETSNEAQTITAPDKNIEVYYVF